MVIVSGRQQRDSAMHIYVSILPQTPLPSRLPHDFEQSSLCYTVGPCWLFILNIAECACPSQTSYHFAPPSNRKKSFIKFLHIHVTSYMYILDFPDGANRKEHLPPPLPCKYRRFKRPGFDPWVRKIIWRRAWQPTPVFLPGESCGQRSLAGYSPSGHIETHSWSDLACTHVPESFQKRMKIWRIDQSSKLLYLLDKERINLLSIDSAMGKWESN